MGHIRGHGCRHLLVYYSSGQCHHGATLSGDDFPEARTAAIGLEARTLFGGAPSC
jgi:hypothetical protein